MSSDNHPASRTESSFLRKLEAARDGRSPELGKLLDRFRDYLLLIADQELPGNVQPKVAPSDLVQEIYLDVRQSLSAFQGATESDFRSWLRAILIHNIRDTTRRFHGTEKRNVDREVSLVSDVARDERRPGDANQHLADFDHADFIAEMLNKAPGGLPPSDRTASS